MFTRLVIGLTLLLLCSNALADTPTVVLPRNPFEALSFDSIRIGALASSSDGNQSLTFAWDLNNDGLYTDSFLQYPVFLASGSVGTHFPISVQVTDANNDRTIASTTVNVVASYSPGYVPFDPATVPEPASLVLLGAASFGVLYSRRRAR